MEKNSYLTVRNLYKKGKYYLSGILSFLIILIKALEEFTSLLKKFSPFNIVIALSLLVIIVVFFFQSILKDIEVNQEPKNLVKYVKPGKIIVWFFLFIPCFFWGSYLHSKFINQKQCETDLKKTAVFIARFSSNSTDYDAFSNALYVKLNISLHYTDTLNVKLLSKQLLDSNHASIEDIKQTFQENCSDTGLIVYGYRLNQNIDPMFDCRIYYRNFLDSVGREYIKNTEKPIFYILNPNELNFTIDYQSSAIASIIEGQLLRRAGQYELANGYFSKALSLNNNQSNTQLIGILHFFIGNDFIKLHNIPKASDEFNAGHKADSTNEYVIYNLAAIDNNTGKIEKAYGEYETAHKLNYRLINPLHKIYTLTKSPKPQNLKKPDFKYKLVDTLKVTNKIDTSKKNIIVKEKWNEQCYTILLNNKYGVVNNRKDTIVRCLYDAIESFPYKNADCFIVKLNNKFGAFVHIHYDDGYTIHEFPVEYSERSIKEALVYCIDNHAQF